jgi:tRNA-binding protein
MEPVASFSNFEALDIRVGRIVRVEDAETRKPTYRITVDFGPEIGMKVPCGAFRRYTKEELLGKLIIAVVNFGPKKMGPETSEGFCQISRQTGFVGWYVKPSPPRVASKNRGL